MRKILSVFIIAVLILSLSACGEKKDSKYCSSLVDTGYKNLYYDTRTNIVYYVVGNRMTVYYCEHGVPYSFDSKTGELVCINN